jgi:ubiquinone/menaquinone biosynthesis methyltransferase
LIPPSIPENAAAFQPEADNVFARIATRYDRLCDIFSLGIHRHWKARLAKHLAKRRAGIILDAASGTGHIAQRMLKRLNASGDASLARLHVTDLCPQMLDVARQKPGMGDGRVEFAIRDVHDLKEIPGNSIDLYSIAFAMKITQRQRVVAEALRVLKPGGYFYCLEAARIPNPLIQALYLKYMDWCLPLIGKLGAGGDRSAYDYLLRGIHAFPAQAVFAEELRQAGFADIAYESLTLGIVAIHWARKP